MSAAPHARPSIVLSLSSVDDTVEAARLAEQAGFESVWATEFYDRCATVAIAAMAQATERVTLGSAIAYAFGRTPLVLAAEMRDLDQLSGGRLIMGLGTGTKRMQRDWHGLDGEHPAPRMEELVPLAAAAAAPARGARASTRAASTASSSSDGAGGAPAPRRHPVLHGRRQPADDRGGRRGRRRAGGHPLFTREYVHDVVRPALARGAERAGRAEPPPIAGYLTCA